MRSVLRLCVWVVLVCLLAAPAAAQPRMPNQNPQPDPSPGSLGPPSGSPSAPSQSNWGAIAFTAEGSYATAWQQPSKAEAEANVLRRCAKFGRGACEVATTPGQCLALATVRAGRWRLAFTAGGTTTPEAQQNAKNRCNGDKRSRNRCEIKISICGDGR